MAKVRVMISVADEKVDQLAAVASALRGAGVDVEQTLESLGTIVGSVDEARLSAVARLPGVASVERQGVVTLPPPDSEIQ